ncbi:putative GTPase activating protein (Evi5) [Aspergillus candidus]|uniref:Rab-GAP TBC domain-containing protein n=1 Tax=Aspergillus candidus TaxID=41067 RepID=A0A2I2F2S5_ASPCN|nr:hypothetical protein BDW47DRAFT_119971 [Aspergillus candidus]PLB34945.1 hypothetical protein BDW47DRAFT_119971 [Aspergillus candidus]
MVTVPLSPNSERARELSQVDLARPDWQSPDVPQAAIAVTAPSESAPDDDDDAKTLLEPVAYRASAASSIRSRSSEEIPRSELDWEELDRTEEQEPRGDSSDESTALLLARLEQENNALATNPKSGMANVQAQYAQRQSRSQSLHQIKRLIDEDPNSSLRYSQLAPPPMTELEFWAALVADYSRTAHRLPTLTTNKIRGGVPAPLRGVVWPSLAGARDSTLLSEFQRLCGESSPYEGLIGKDIGRSFPNVEMFRDPNGEGQQMLGRVLKCFSLYDTQIGYCQGLGFVVGPLLMHMTDAEAFCVLVRLMDHYDLRTCYLPDLSGLHLHVYQFQNLLSRLRPALFAHLEALNVEPVYVSQWFLSFFAVSCPLPMLLRIYDVIFLEGACETLMRVALSLMQRNEKRILACAEFEDVLQLLLSRSLWDTYACHADDFVNDFVSLTSLVTKESLQTLEASYNQSQGVPTGISFPQMQAAASRFLGRFWAGSGSSSSSVKSLNLTPNAPAARGSILRRSTSKQSITSTLNSVESSSDASTAPTELSPEPSKPRAKSAMTPPNHKDRDLHTQIEDLLMALGDLQRQHTDLTRQLQQEREEREEDQALAQSMLQHVKQTADDSTTELVRKADERFAARKPSVPSDPPPHGSSALDTKHQLRDDLARWKEMHAVEAERCLGLTRRIDDHERETTSLREELREARGRIQDGYRDRQRLERTVRDLRNMKMSTARGDTPPDVLQSPISPTSPSDGSKSGLRELKLVRSNSQSQKRTSLATKRSSTGARSSMGAVLAESTNINNNSNNNNNRPPAEEALLMELVTSKTAEAVAKQELEEVKAKMEGLRRMVGGAAAGGLLLQQQPVSRPALSRSGTTIERSHNRRSMKSAEGGGFFGWGRRAVSAQEEPVAN